MVVRLKSVLLTIAFICLGFPPLSALGRGEAGSADSEFTLAPADRVRMTLVVEYAGADSNTLEAFLDDPTLMSALADVSAPIPTLSVVPRVVREAPSPAQIREAAAENGSLLWMRVVLDELDQSVAVDAQAGAVNDGEVLLRSVYEVPIGPAGVSYRRLWQPLQRELASAFEQMETTALGAVGSGTLRLQTVAGAQVRVDGADEAVAADEAGTLAIDLHAPATYDIELRAPGHYPVTGQFLLTSAGASLSIKPDERSLWLYDVGFENASFPFFDARRRFLGDYLFAQAGATTYVIGFASLADTPETYRPPEGLFTSTSATDLRLGVGSYINGIDAARRFYSSLGVTGRLVHGAGIFALDPAAPLTTHLSFGLEGNPDRRRRLFVEWAPALVISDFPDIVEARFPGVTYLPESWSAVVPAAGYPLALGFVRLGIRWQP